MYAIIETGGKQLKVKEGQTINVEKLNVEPGDTVTFDNVVFVGGGEQVKTGTPHVEGASVTAKVDQHGLGKKIVIFKFKRRKKYRRKQGHRQPYTQLSVEKINA